MNFLSSFLAVLALFTGHSSTNSSPTDQRIKEAYQFCQMQGMNTDFCILIDMDIHSGKKRFFVYDFNERKVINRALVSHGCCDGIWAIDGSAENPAFSNIPDSHCSSLGKYKIGQRGYSNWGIHINYKLHGLEATNDKAFQRYIVLHSWEAIGDEATYPWGSPEGWGCPAVSNKQMRYLDDLLKNVEKPVLMWIYK